MADRMETLERQIVGIIAGFARGTGPVDQRGAQAFAHFLLLLIQELLRHFLPREAQVAHGRNHPPSDRFSRREKQRSFVAVIVLTREEVGRRFVGQITGCKNVRKGRSEAA